jgi:hypothetical protein
MLPLAHIGNIPVEEYAGFYVPIILLVAYGLRRRRRDRRALARLPALDSLDEQAVERVLARWAGGGHEHATRELLPLMYPPGPDGATYAELAERIDADEESVRERCDDLADLGYLELDGDPSAEDARGWLTPAGVNLMNLTEEALLEGSRENQPTPPGTGVDAAPAGG